MGKQLNLSNSSNELATGTSANVNSELIEPRTFDVLCGKDKQCVGHAGSKRFRVIIESYRLRYSQCVSKYDKMMITKEIYDSLSEKQCRFLRFDSKANVWDEIPTMAARDKIGHSLRFANRETRRRRRRNQTSSNDSVCSSSSTSTATTVSSSSSSGNSFSSSRAASPVPVATKKELTVDLEFPTLESLHVEDEEALKEFLPTHVLPSCGSMLDLPGLNQEDILGENQLVLDSESTMCNSSNPASMALNALLDQQEQTSSRDAWAREDDFKSLLLNDSITVEPTSLLNDMIAPQFQERKHLQSSEYLPLLQENIMEWDEFDSEFSPAIFA